MTPSQTARPGGSAGAGGAFTNLCALCNGHRLIGSLLTFRPGVDEMLWVCDDCQHKLARRVDDEGALGG